MRTSVIAVLTALVALSGCGAAAEQASRSGGDRAPSATTSTPRPAPSSSPSAAPSSIPAPAASPEAGRRLEPAGPATSDGTPRAATLTIPQIGLRGFAVRPYRGTTDDAPGTEIQNAGDLASPFGPDGGVGPGSATTWSPGTGCPRPSRSSTCRCLSVVTVSR